MVRGKKRLGATPGLDILTYAALGVSALVALFPVLWGLTTALKTDGEVNAFPPTLIPSEVSFQNFSSVDRKSVV